MPQSPENYYRPENLDEALTLLAQPDVVALGGGTKLLSNESGLSVYGVVDLQALGLNKIVLENDVLRVGATTKLVDLAEYLQENLATAVSSQLLQKAIKQAGPNTYRNAATIGGTIGEGIADSELLAALLVMDATLTIENKGKAIVPLYDYLAEKREGLITSVSINASAGNGSSHRVARTPADYPIVSITCWQPPGETPRLAATGIAERPFRLSKAEMALKDGLSETAVDAATQAAKKACTHTGDFRGDSNYRAEMAAVLTKRALLELS